MLRSVYGRHSRVLVNVTAPYTDRHVSFAAWLEHAYRNLPAGILGVADYERTIEIYQALFGADRIALLRLEEWTADDGSFDDRLSAILGFAAVTTRQYMGNRHTDRRRGVKGKEGEVLVNVVVRS